MMPGRPHVTALVAVCAGLLAACGPSKQSGDTSTTDGGGEATTPAGEPTTEPQLVTSGECPGQPLAATDGTSGVADTTESGGQQCADHTSVDACCCMVDGYPIAGVVCDRTYLCQEIVIQSQLPDSPEETTSCPAAIDCALDALIAGEPGTIRWRIPSLWGQEVMEIHIIGDGTAMVSHMLVADLGCSGTAERRTLRNSYYFTQCAMKPSALQRFECIREPALSEVLETCDAQIFCGDPP